MTRQRTCQPHKIIGYMGLNCCSGVRRQETMIRSVSRLARTGSQEYEVLTVDHEKIFCNRRIVERVITMDLKPYDFGADKVKATNGRCFSDFAERHNYL